MDKNQIQLNLAGKIDDETFSWIESHFPIKGECPTCGGSKRYAIDYQAYDCDCNFQKLLQRHYYAANIGKEYHNLCIDDFFSDDKDKIVPIISDYIENFENNAFYGLGITFSGGIGTGKTFAMNCVLKELIKQGRRVYFVNFEQLIDAWASRYQDEDSKRILTLSMNADLLGIDEVNTDKRNEGGFLARGFDRVVRHRTGNLLPTLITTNMTQEEERGEYFKVFSLLSARNTRVTTEGHDVRIRELRQRNFDMKKRGERRPLC